MVTEISKAEVKRIVDILRLELPGAVVIAPDLVLERKPELLKCTNCGKVSYDRDEVDYFVVHIGGKGDVRQPECVNQPACFKRMGW